MHVEGLRMELSRRGREGALGDVFSKITILDLDGKKRILWARGGGDSVSFEINTKVVGEKDRLDRVEDRGEDFVYCDEEKGAAQQGT